MIREPLGNYSDIISSQVFVPYKFNAKPSLPYSKPKKAQNIPDVYYDGNDFTNRIVNQIALDNYSNQIKESFDNIGYIPKVTNSNSGNIIIHPKKIEQSIQTIQKPTYMSAKQAKRVGSTPFYTPQTKGSTPIKSESDFELSPNHGDSSNESLDYQYKSSKRKLKKAIMDEPEGILRRSERLKEKATSSKIPIPKKK